MCFFAELKINYFQGAIIARAGGVFDISTLLILESEQKKEELSLK